MDIKLMPKEYKEQVSRRGMPSSKRGISRFGHYLNDVFFQKGGLWFYLSILLLVLTVMACLGLWLYRSSLKSEKEDLFKEVNSLHQQRDKEAEDNFIKLSRTIEALKGSIDDRVYASNIFDLLEELTLPNVQFTNFSADLNKSEIKVNVMVSNYKTMARQAVAFRNDERIKKVSLGEISLDTFGQAASSMELRIDSSFLKERPSF